MKKIILSALAGALLVGCASEKKTDGYTISFDVTNFPSEKVYLSRYVDGDFETIDSAQVTDGKAEFTGKLEGPEVLYLKGSAMQRPQNIFLYNDQVTISGSLDSLRNLKITGSTYQDKMMEFQNIEENFRTVYSQFGIQFQEASADSNQAMIDSLSNQVEILYENFQKEQKEFAKSAGIVGAYIAERFFYEPDLELYRAVYDQIPVNMSGSPYKDLLKKKIETFEKTAIGMPIIPFTQKDTSGVDLSIRDIKGKFILIDFWASWCSPCRAANPELVALYSEYHDKGFQIVGVSLDDNGSKWKRAIIQDHLTWPQMSDLKGWRNEGAALYGIKAIPQSVLYNEFGQIVAKNQTPEELSSFLAENL